MMDTREVCFVSVRGVSQNAVKSQVLLYVNPVQEGGGMEQVMRSDSGPGFQVSRLMGDLEVNKIVTGINFETG